MTEYEVTDLLTNMINGGTPVLAVFITIVSGYLIVAWLVGQKLTGAQVTLINMVFIVFAPMMIFAWVARFRAALRLQEKLRSINSETYGVLSGELIAAVAVTLLILVVGCVKFMWDVRHPKTQ